MLRCAGFGDGDDSLLAEDPGEHDLGGGGFVAFSDFDQLEVFQERSLLDGRVGHEGHVVFAGPVEQVELDAAVGQVVEDLIGGAVAGGGEGSGWVLLSWVRGG